MATRQRRRSDDPFFADGDRASLRDAEIIVIFYMEETQSIPQNSIGNAENWFHHEEDPVEQDGSYNYKEVSSSFPCYALQCSKVFDSVTECEMHYLENHTFECSVCNKSFSHDSILDLHIQESHDSYFQSALQKGKARYQCLVTSCKSSFPTESERTLHLQNVHGYPRWFRFHPSVRGTENNGMRSSSVRRKMQWWRRKRGGYPLPSSSSVVEEHLDGNGNGINDDDDDVIQLQCQSTSDDGGGTPPPLSNDYRQPSLREKHDNRNKAHRKERRKKNNATIPCRFYNQTNGCWRGDCMFLHSKVPLMNTLDTPTSQTQEIIDSNSSGALALKAGEDSIDTEMMDELTSQIQSKARISIPAKISFGRRRPR